MNEVPGLSSGQNGHAIIEGYIQSDYDRVHDVLRSRVEPFVEGLRGQCDEKFEWLARSLIRGYDSIKADRAQPVEVAYRTFAVSRLIATVALPHPPTVEWVPVIQTHTGPAIPEERQYESIFRAGQTALLTSKAFNRLIVFCSPSIDPNADEPDMIPLFAGFSLLALGSGEIKRTRLDMEAAASMLAEDDGDIWELFDE